MFRWAVILAVMGGCRIKDLDLEGKACPCPGGWTCDAVRQVCTVQPLVDAPSDGDDELAHVTLAPGWSVHVLKDLTGVLPYNANDFMDGTSVSDNAPTGVAALYAPFTADLAISAGRSIIELARDGHTTVHDFTPAAANTTGPDELAHLCFGTPATPGPRLWAGAHSLTDGDGVYQFSSTWAIVRDEPLNNVVGVGCDNKGSFDGLGIAKVYVVDQNALYRRDSTSMFVPVYVNASLRQIAVTAAVMFTVQDPSGTDPTKMDLLAVAATTHAAMKIATSTRIDLAEGGDPSRASAVALRDQAALVVYDKAGIVTPIAASTDPAWQWNAASAPQVPHFYAGGYVVLESNRALNQDRLLLFTSP